jgi:glycosyltransferase involved in cell wall biosynthesis
LKSFDFSIITVVYNDPINLESTILSVINQRKANFQYIIIDGGSTDETLEVINKYSDDIDEVISEKDSGIYDAMNKGVKYAKGIWVNFLNAGDLYVGDLFLSNLHAEIKNQNVDIYYTDFIIKGNLFSPILNSKYLLRNMLCHQSIFYKRLLLTKNQFNLKYRYCSDFEHLVKLFPVATIKKISGNSVYYLGGGFSADSKIQKRILAERLEIVRRSDLTLIYKFVFTLVNYLQKLKVTLCISQ